MTCNGMAFFQANFMLQTPHEEHVDHHHHHQPTSNSLNNPILQSQDFHAHPPLGIQSFLGKRSMSFSGIDVGGGGGGDQETNGEDDLSDDGSQAGEKKRRLNMEQVKTLEKNFELGNKLEPERKMQLARALGLQPRQIAIWFQNRRARWKTKQLEKDYDVLKRQYEAVKADNDALQAQNQKLHAEIMALKSREITESINLNKETEGSCSNRSDENSSDIKLDISRSTPAIESPLSTTHIVPTSRSFFPSSSSSSHVVRPPPTTVAQLFHNSSRSLPPPPHDHHHHHNMNGTGGGGGNKEADQSLSTMFCGMDDQSGFWPWLEQQHFN